LKQNLPKETRRMASTRKIKVLHLITGLKIGGAESALCNFLEHDADKNYSHRVLYFYNGPNVYRLKDLNIPTKQIVGLLSPYDPIAFVRIIKEIKKIKPDIIHAALWSATILGRLAGAITNVPVICDIHGDCSHHGTIRNALDTITLPLAKHFVAVAPSVKEAFIKQFGPRKNISVILNGIDAKGLQKKALTYPITRKEVGLTSSDFVIGAIGRLHSIKRYDILIKAFSKMLQSSIDHNQPPKLCIIGGGSEEKPLRTLVLNLGIQSHVLFLGERTDAYRFYPLFDCFVLSSASEGLSISLLEALSFGLSIITTNAKKNHDILEQGKNGLIIPPLKKEALTLALLRIYRDEKLRKNMSLENINTVKTQLHIDVTIDAYQELYKKCVNKSNSFDT
jgi:glycosyltransferase involved in cell wall biosynthesis